MQTLPAVQVTRSSAAVLKVTGSLVFDSVAEALRNAESALRQAPADTLDLGEVTIVDSAGLAWVLSVLATGRRLHGKFGVINPPPGLAALARVCEVESLLT